MGKDSNTVEVRLEADDQGELESARREAANSHDKYLRALADAENMRKRLERLCEERIWQEKRRLLTHIVELGDQLDDALQYAEVDDPLGSGVRLTWEALQRTLTTEGVEVVESTGEHFDPAVHEAVEVSEYVSSQPNTVTLEYRRGYLLDGKLLRPARVQVSPDR
jgi:molecular chaperone GrpE